MTESTVNLPSDKPNQSTRILFFALIAMGMGQTIVFAALPLIGRELLYSELQINLLVSSAALMYFLATPHWGRFSQRVGRKSIILMGLFGYTVGTVIFNLIVYAGFQGVVAGTFLFALLIISRALLTAMMAAVQPGAIAYTADNSQPGERTKAMGKLVAASGIGAMIGPSLTLFADYSLLAPLYLQAMFTLLAGVLIAIYLPESKMVKLSKDEKPIKLSYFDPRIRLYLTVGFIMYAMMGVVQQTLAYYFQDLLQLNSVDVIKVYGFSMMGSSSMMLFSQLVIVQRWGWQPRRLLVTGLSLAMVGYGLLAISSHQWQLMGAMLIFGLGMGLSGPGFNAGATLQVKPEEQGALAGLITSAPGLGFVIGPLLGAFLYSIDIHLPYWVASLTFIPLLAYCYSVFYRK